MSDLARIDPYCHECPTPSGCRVAGACHRRASPPATFAVPASNPSGTPNYLGKWAHPERAVVPAVDPSRSTPAAVSLLTAEPEIARAPHDLGVALFAVIASMQAGDALVIDQWPDSATYRVRVRAADGNTRDPMNDATLALASELALAALLASPLRSAHP